MTTAAPTTAPTIPHCSYCESEGEKAPAHYDGQVDQTEIWAYMCERHFHTHCSGCVTRLDPTTGEVIKGAAIAPIQPPSSNRVSRGIQKAETRIAQALAAGRSTQEELKVLREKLDLDAEEHSTFQELKSSVMGLLLNSEEAQLVYMLLGSTPEHFNKQSLSVKVTLTRLFEELLDIVIKAKREGR